MTMSTEVFVVVLAAALLHASWNAMAKGAAGSDPIAASAAIGVGAGVVSAAAMLSVGLPDWASAPYVVASALIHVAYFVLVALGYAQSDYSVVYALNRGTAPLGTALISAGLLGETMSIAGWAGIVLLSAGIVGMGLEALRQRGLTRRGVLLAGTTALVIMLYTVVDGLGARASGNAVAYVTAMIALTAVGVLPAMQPLRPGLTLASLAGRWRFGLLGGLLVTLSYGTAVWAMTKAPIGLVGALRETSVLFATVIAAVLLKERLGASRWVAAIAIVAGIALIRLA